MPLARAAQREVGDVDVVLPEHRSDPAHNAGHVEIAQVDDVALQRRFHVDAVDLQQPSAAPRAERVPATVFSC